MNRREEQRGKEYDGTFIVHDMSIKTVIVPNFSHGIVFEPSFEFLKDTCSIAYDEKIEGWKIKIVPYFSMENRRAEDFPLFFNGGVDF